MPRKQTVSSPVADVQSMVAGQLEDARKKLVTLEKELIRRGRAQQKELKTMISNLRAGKQIKALGKQAAAAGTQMRKRLGGVQTQVFSKLGVATRNEMVELHKELIKISKKVDRLVTTKKPTTAPKLLGS
jgi:polyhydroxyalkanoate synthesis regulator phasin